MKDHYVLAVWSMTQSVSPAEFNQSSCPVGGSQVHVARAEGPQSSSSMMIEMKLR